MIEPCQSNWKRIMCENWNNEKKRFWWICSTTSVSFRSLNLIKKNQRSIASHEDHNQDTHYVQGSKTLLITFHLTQFSNKLSHFPLKWTEFLSLFTLARFFFTCTHHHLGLVEQPWLLELTSPKKCIGTSQMEDLHCSKLSF